MRALTAVLRDVTSLRQVPEGERTAAALALVPDLDEALTGVTAETGVRAWVSLARAAGRQVQAVPDPEAARAATLSALGSEPVDWRGAIRAAASDAESAARRLRTTAAAAREAGVAVAELARLASVTRQTIYDWTPARAPAPTTVSGRDSARS